MNVLSNRENEISIQTANTGPPFQPVYGIPQVIHQSFQSTFVDNMHRSQILPTDQYGSMRPLWYDPYTER